MICGFGLMHVLSLTRTFTVPVPHPDHGFPLSSAELAYTSVPHGVLHGTPPVSCLAAMARELMRMEIRE